MVSLEILMAEAIVLVSNTGTSWAGSGRWLAGRMDVLVFRAVLRSSVVRQYRNYFFRVWLGLAVAGWQFALALGKVGFRCLMRPSRMS